MPVTQDDVLGALKECYDPEIPVNIVDLGLIYEVKFADVKFEGAKLEDGKPEDAKPEGVKAESAASEASAENKQDVTVDMTLTAQGCPEHVNISAQVKARLEQLPGIRNASVNIIWNPPWTPDRLSAEARKTLGIE